MTALNNDLIDKVMAKIKEDPDAWDQGSWICKTTACFAGHALIESGLYEVKVDRDEECPYDSPDCQCGVSALLVNKETGLAVSVQIEAQKLLGFTDREAMRVFLDITTDLELMTATISGIRANRVDLEAEAS